jgi:hypothetical protein
MDEGILAFARSNTPPLEYFFAMAAPLRTSLHSRVRVVDNDVSGRPQVRDLHSQPILLPQVVQAELDYAVIATDYDIEEFLLAALGRAIARTFGLGMVTVNGSMAAHPIRLHCVTHRESSADSLLKRTRGAITAPSGPAAAGDVIFSCLASAPAPEIGPLQAGDRAALGILAYYKDDVVEIDWWYDGRRLFGETIEELSKQFVLGLIELTSDASPKSRSRLRRPRHQPARWRSARGD